MGTPPEEKLYESPSFTQRTVFIPPGQDYKVLVTSRLAVVKGKDRGKELVVRKERITIGRSRSCDLVLSDRAVSQIHAELLTDEKGRMLRDLGSKNGVLFMGHQVNELRLKPDSQIQIGNNLVRFEPLDAYHKIPLSPKNRFGRALGRSVAMRGVFAVLEKVSRSTLPMLLLGETGTGKELIAEAIHANSRRSNRPFMVIDCGAVPPDIVESTLFGHEKGAFTGADVARRGAFEEAHRGTVFLDEIGELPAALQPKLLRVLDRKEVQRVGGVKRIPVDMRIVAATSRDLRAMIDEDLFREDLLYRLSGMEVRIPPLRERLDDIVFLAESFLQTGNEKRREIQLPPLRLESEAVGMLESYPWPGNVRELRNVMERTAILVEGDSIGRRDLQLQMDLLAGGAHASVFRSFRGPYKQAKARLLEQFERQYLADLLRENGGNLTHAARQAKLVRHHLRDLCQRHGFRYGAEAQRPES